MLIFRMARWAPLLIRDIARQLGRSPSTASRGAQTPTLLHHKAEKSTFHQHICSPLKVVPPTTLNQTSHPHSRRTLPHCWSTRGNTGDTNHSQTCSTQIQPFATLTLLTSAICTKTRDGPTELSNITDVLLRGTSSAEWHRHPDNLGSLSSISCPLTESNAIVRTNEQIPEYGSTLS